MYYATFPLKMDTNLVFFICIILKTHRMNIYIQTYEDPVIRFLLKSVNWKFQGNAAERYSASYNGLQGCTAQVDQTAQGLMCNRTLTFMAKTFIFMFRENSTGN